MGPRKRSSSRYGVVFLPGGITPFSCRAPENTTERALRRCRDALLVFLQFQRNGVDAIAHPGGLWSIIEDVPEVGVAPAALHYRAPHAVAGVVFGLDCPFAGRSVETGPTGPRMKFGFGSKKGLAAADTFVGTGGFGVIIFAGEGRFSALLPRHKILILRELLLPGYVILTDLLFHGISFFLAILSFPSHYQIQLPASRFRRQSNLDCRLACCGEGPQLGLPNPFVDRLDEFFYLRYWKRTAHIQLGRIATIIITATRRAR